MKVSWESSVAGPQHSVRLLRLQLAAFAAPLHAHDALELTWIERGAGLRFVGGDVAPFDDGDLVLLAPGLPHTWHTRGEPPEGVRATVLQLDLTAAAALLPEWRQQALPLLQRAGQGLRLHGALHARTSAALAALPHAPGLALLGGALALLGMLADAPDDALAPIDRSAPRVARPKATVQRRLDGLLAWVQANLGAPLSAQEAAAHLHVTPGAFARSFQRLVGKPFSAYVNDLRVGEACLLLRQSDRPVAEVAQRCGFATLSHFNAEFRRRTGTTPRAYRRG
ncbi:MAG: AraC family transcriptional regulator [Inhella sp.]|uniref:helix-turn-helix transcriptional regulator n=1 Tax=Inhella sp. TaxID=1921806 RepID=UPI0022C85C16|nr:AraC family transcriptional regulator [Inhella sp.]MCZ8236290.1 AraC family transcriptional regulator [Inhella sp.]